VSKAIEVITSVERRRRWSAAEKERLVSASLEAGASVSAVAREAGIQPSQCMAGDGSCFDDRSRG
jgi:transposase